MSTAQAVALPLFLIGIGVGWLLTSLEVIPEVNWLWPGMLAACGALVLIMGGLDKFTIVFGPLLLLASVFSVLRQTDRIALNVEMPALMIVLGVLVLIAQLSPLPAPKWLVASRQG